jgi:hypothetical protein
MLDPSEKYFYRSAFLTISYKNLLDFLTNVSLKENKAKCKVENSVLTIPDPGYWIQKQQQKRREKKFVVLTFFVATRFTIF